MASQSRTTAVRNMQGNRYLVFTAFVSGAVVMVIELLGSRIIGPPFGVSLFVWTSLITVALVSLAIGYWIGGRIADIRNSPGTLFAIILSAGLYLLIIPIIKNIVIEASLGLGLRAGSLASSVILFGPPLFLLGMVTPYIVKLYMASGMEGLGKTVGGLYAISTCGSFIGTIGTGFLLIPNLGVNNIIYLSSFTLIGISALYWIAFQRSYLAIALAVVPIALLLTPKTLPSLTRPDGTKVSVVFKEDTAYGQIKVVDYTYEGSHLREFLLDNMIQGSIDMNTGLSLNYYTYYLERLAHAYRKDAKNAVVIGLGAGIIPERFQKHYGIKTDAVDIDPEVVEAADRYFPFDKGSHGVYIQDGRYFLKNAADTYDIIILDAFAGDAPPSHLISLEAFELAKNRLSGNGVLLLNFISNNDEDGRLVISSLYGTLKKAFANVDVYVPEKYYLEGRRISNFAIAAYDAPLSPQEPSVAPPVYAPLNEDVEGMLARPAYFKEGPAVFTDDYNPVDYQNTRIREELRFSTILTADKAITID